MTTTRAALTLVFTLSLHTPVVTSPTTTPLMTHPGRVTPSVLRTASSDRSSQTPPYVLPTTDSVCTTTQVSGTVTDSTGNGKPGLWVVDGQEPSSDYPNGHKVKTDAHGVFQLMSDNIHAVLWVYSDSARVGENGYDIGMYEKRRLQVKNCVASPITIGIHK